MDLSSLTSSIKSAFSDLSDTLISSIGDVLPYILVVVGAVILIGVAVHLFKRFVQ